MGSKLRCVQCDAAIGVYEPLMVVVAGEARETSRAAEPDLPLDAAEYYHRACYLEHIGAAPA